mmetsp:Transcript_8265/g.18956  ORF Transcript_8265/g.18956 Transcript_8265/m.18956 type:complete len:102 (-) Transcript_8265:114-419(-)
MLRYQLFFSVGVLFISVWKALLSNLSTVKATASTNLGLHTTHAEILVIYLPIWAIAALGIYALTSVLYRVATFGDCPGAADDLGRRVIVAKEKLKGAGFSF